MKKFKEILNEDVVLGLAVCAVVNVFFAIAAIL